MIPARIKPAFEPKKYMLVEKVAIVVFDKEKNELGCARVEIEQR